MGLTYNAIASRRLDRIGALSDGVFAIAMTLIVLEIHVPDPGPIRSEQDLWNGLLTLGPRLVTYLLSFLTLGIFWNGQQTQLNLFATADRDLTWIQVAFLATVALMPFSTSLLAEFITFRLALLIYWANIFLIGALLLIAWIYATRHGLVTKEATPTVSALIKRRIFVAQALYAFGALLCFINPLWSIAFIVLVQLNFAIAPRIPILSRI
jgi:TMEM175 potassium channel family protein